MSAGSTYSIASMGTTTQAQWVAAGAGPYVNTGSTFVATAAAAAGTGLVVLMGSGAGVYLRADNGAAGGSGLTFSIDFSEG
jgi:hypothetical protein